MTKTARNTKMTKESYSPEFQKLFDSYHPKFQDTLKEWSRAFSTTKEFEEWWEKSRYKEDDSENGKKVKHIYATSIGSLKINPL